MEQVQEAGDVGGVGAQRVGDGARHGAHGRLVEDHGHAGHRPLHRGEVDQVPADHLEAPLAPREVEVGSAAGGEVVEDPHPVAVGEEPLHQVGADEARSAGHQRE